MYDLFIMHVAKDSDRLISEEQDGFKTDLLHFFLMIS